MAEPGIGTVPDGQELYRLAIRMQTTVSTTAEEVHAFGLEDLSRIEAEMDEIAHRLGHPDRHALKEALNVDPTNHTDSREAIVQLAEGQTERAYAAAPQYFGRLPSANCVVKAVEEYRERETPPAFYMPPSLDGSRQGQYYINTYQPEERPLHKIAADHLPRGDAGPPLPDRDRDGADRACRRSARWAAGWRAWRTSRAGASTASGSPTRWASTRTTRSGWACSTRRPSAPRGWWSTPGCTPCGWTREQAIEFMHERGSLPMVDAEIEVDRYIVWPGPGAGLQDRPARDRARCGARSRSALGDRFDLRAFHDEVLGHGRCRWRPCAARSQTGSRRPWHHAKGAG